MPKDPAFLFYPGDWNLGTMHMTHLEKGCYMDLLLLQFARGQFTEAQAKHMLNGSFDIAWPTVSVKFTQNDGFYYNERLKHEMERRKKFTESRKNNGSIPKKTIKEAPQGQQHMHKHMENTNDNEVSVVPIQIQVGETRFFSDLYKTMMGMYLSDFPAYFKDDERDYSACWAIVQKTEKLKGWVTGGALNGNMPDFIVFWAEIVRYVRADSWLSSRSLSDLSTGKEWQRLGQHMNNVANNTSSKEQRKKKEESAEKKPLNMVEYYKNKGL